MTRILLNTIISCLFLIGACTPLSRQALEQVDTTAPFQEIRGQPDKFLNRTVLWGGVIIETTVRKDGTFIKVLQTGLDSSDMPQDPEKSEGRFIVYDRGFLDPAIYKQGRKITVVGRVTGKESLPLGAIMYAYPVIEAKDIYLWRPQPRYPAYPYYYPYYPYHPFYYPPFYYPYPGPYPYGWR